MNADNTTVLYGPPGTGKTTALLTIVDDSLRDGILPTEIMFIAFTRKAAYEARDRAIERFSLEREKLPWFRTLHSLAFERLGLERRNVLSFGDYIKLANALGLSITVRGYSEDGSMPVMTKGDRLIFMENMARATKQSLREYWEQWPDEDVYWYELERFAKTLSAYKSTYGKHDFTDIITSFIGTAGPIPGVRVMIVDEAQDLSPLQWDMVEVLSTGVERVFIAGDDDQAIFRWAGADVNRFINLEGDRRILSQSHRVPVEIQHLANNIATRITTRVTKTWSPRSAAGAINYITEIGQTDMSKGTWLLLARNIFLLDNYVHHCMREGFLFQCATGGIARSETFRAIATWERLLRGEKVRAVDIKNVYAFMTTKVGVGYGFKKRIDEVNDDRRMDVVELRSKFGLLTLEPWDTALDKLTAEERTYFSTAKERGENINAEPRIRIDTIHGVKGGEADNVVLCSDMALRTYSEFQKNPDDEHRVWYVGVTRAKETLHILQPTTNQAYEL
jgi:DNA helicase II / ATP-dependent DNA helicase PcrA